MNFEEIEKLVIQWGKDRTIFEQSSDSDQVEKLREELNELDYAIDTLPTCISDIEDAIGDMVVVLTMIASFNGLTITQCYEAAYNQIKDRRGKMVNGLFVKE